MARKPQDVTDAELAVLQVLWEREIATIRQVTDIVYPADPARQYSTVKRLLARLEAKGCVRRDSSGPLLQFAATLQRNDLVARRLEGLAETLCEGSISPLLLHMAQKESLTKKQRQTLLDLIDQLDRISERETGKTTK